MTDTPATLKVDMRGWPAGLVDVADVIGPEAALALVRAWGGVPIYIPKTMDANHAIAAIIGLEAGLKLCAWRPVSQLLIPTLYAARSKKAMIAAARGNNRSIARSLGVTDRYVRLVRNVDGTAMGPTDEDEPSLF